MARLARPALLLTGALLASFALGACSEDAGGSSDSDAIGVTSSDDACDVGRTTAPAGTVTFAVENTGGQVTEFYVYGADGQTILSEVENIGPGLTRDLTVSLEPGIYVTACKPGMTGDGIRQQFEAVEAGAGSTAADDPELVAASSAYVTWVRGQAAELLTLTEQFVAAVKAGDVETAKALYPVARAPWERIEPVAESFGDLDPKLDARINDVEPGTEFTGWHRLEKDLWEDGLQADSGEIADLMLADTQDLVTRIESLELTGDRVTNGAKELLDEVATSKITGEEDRYSHTDLWDFQANVEGAREAYDVVADIVTEKDAELAATLDERFDTLFAALDGYRSGDGFVLYTALTEPQIQDLSAKVEALSEPLSELTVTIVG